MSWTWTLLVGVCRSCLRRSTRQLCTWLSRPSCPCTPPVVRLVSYWTLATACPIPCQSTRVTRCRTPSCVWIWPGAILRTTWWRSWRSVATVSPRRPSVRSFVTSRRSCATWRSTSSRRWPPPQRRRPSRRATSFQTDRSSPSAMSASAAQKPCSNLHSWVWSRVACTRRPTTPSWSATSTSVRTCTPTPSSRAAPPCSRVLPTACRRRSPPWRLPRWKSRSLLRQRGSTPSGSADRSWPPCPHSSRCGSANRNTTSPAHPLYTESASKRLHFEQILDNLFCCYFFQFRVSKIDSVDLDFVTRIYRTIYLHANSNLFLLVEFCLYISCTERSGR